MTESKSIIWSKEVTNIIKGVAILLVVVGHAVSKLRNAGISSPIMLLFSPFGAIGVGLFLLCSGYGLEKSFQRNRLDKFWQKKFKAIFFPYILVELIGLFYHSNLMASEILCDFLMIEPQHPFGWYMQYLMLWYMLFYMFTILDRKYVLKHVNGGG